MRAKWFSLTIFVICWYLSSPAQDISNKAYPEEPAVRSSASIPKGEVLQFSFNHSSLYPGTSRSYWVYIPAGYRPEKPACLFVCLDGVLFNAPTVFDYLITKGEMPMTIGVFISSGSIMGKDGQVIRINRTNEFDNLNGRFARFIEEEILPDVRKQKASDGRALVFSDAANDHMIAGASSGAICAFTAAWQRPDLFSRVFSTIGTYIGMRGGDQYPILIRKTEPRPIRVYLQDNNNDSWNPLFGNWFKSNIDMEAALNFAGYEVTNMWQEGGHDTHQGTAIFADVMRWLWKGWPERVKRGWSANDMLRSLLDSSEGWQTAAPTEITAEDTDGHLLRLPGGERYQVQRGVLSYLPKGVEKGAVVVDKDENLGNALAISPDKQQLVASLRHAHWLYDYTIGPDGKLADKQTLYWLHNPGNEDSTEIHGLAFDTNGNLYVGTAIGVQICDQNGRVRAILPVPGRGGILPVGEAPGSGAGGGISSLWFGGEGRNILYIICGGKIYKRKLKVSGAPAPLKAQTYTSQGGG